MTNSTTLDFVYNEQHFNKATIDVSEVIRIVHWKKIVLTLLKNINVKIERHKSFGQTVFILLI